MKKIMGMFAAAQVAMAAKASGERARASRSLADACARLSGEEHVEQRAFHAARGGTCGAGAGTSVCGGGWCGLDPDLIVAAAQ